MPMHLPLPLHLLAPGLRIDWPLLLASVALGVALAGALTVGLQLRRTRKRVLGTLERVFEQLDLLRFDAQPQLPELPVLAVPAQAPSPRLAQAPQPPVELVDYQAAARLAARGAPLAEIADRCGVGAGEARVLLALQRGAERRRAGAR